VHETRCTLSLDSSGELLHRRGYRLDRGPAPLNEALAAGMILISGWRGDTPFVDPMCGAGTIPIEAAMIRDNIAPGLVRREFGFMRWRDFDERLWKAVLDEARRAVRRQAAPVLGCDINRNAIRHAIENAVRAGLERRATFAPRGVDQVEPPPGPGVAVINPPYGVRIGGNVDALYSAIGDRLKKAFTGYDVWILSANKDALKCIGLRASSRKTLFNGPMQCAFWRYRMYEGSMKMKKRRPAPDDTAAAD
jgi:putative N6-adenine-specific DNA methylase